MDIFNAKGANTAKKCEKFLFAFFRLFRVFRMEKTKLVHSQTLRHEQTLESRITEKFVLFRGGFFQ